MKELIIVLAILIVGYGALALYFRHECRKAKYIEKDISGEKYIEKDMGRREDDERN